MENETFNIDELLIHILSHRASREEIVYFSKWMKQEDHQVYFKKFQKVWNLTSGGHANRSMLDAGLADYRRYMQQSGKSGRAVWLWRTISVAAVVIIGVFVAIRLYVPEEKNLPVGKETVQESRGVMLTLSNGKQVNVLSDSVELIDEAGNDMKISKGNQREIIYESNNALSDSGEFVLAYNEILVPVGERFTLQLSDGTRVWINSESTLRYPVRFGPGRREVEVRGNVYFEVTKDRTRPFIVSGNEMVTEVLGTSFEVNFYGDRGKVSTTLVEGKVRVVAGGHTVTMKPDEQVVFDQLSGKVNVKQVDATNLVRWKDGVLVIDNESFDDVVWKLERWYGVSIVNKTGKKFSQYFSGEFEREDIRATIETICVNLGIQYEMCGDQVILQK